MLRAVSKSSRVSTEFAGTPAFMSPADGMRDQELKLRQDGLLMAADLASRTLSNKVDLLYRILENEAGHPSLQQTLNQYNKAENDELTDAAAAEIQNHLANLISTNSSAMFSTIDGTPCVAFSVPIVDSDDSPDDSPIGVLAIFVSCGSFLDLNVRQPEHQKLLLVEGRTYPLIPIAWDDDHKHHRVTGPSKWSAGVVLHHDDLKAHATAGVLPRVGESMVSEMQRCGQQNLIAAQLVPTDIHYRDPLGSTTLSDNQWIAAFAPVVLESRADDPEVANTGWYVIVQQEMVSRGE